MKNTDLMIGDWVQHGEGVCKVVSIAGKGIFFEDSISEGVATFDMIFPIPLTPEILEKNGWKDISTHTLKGCDTFRLRLEQRSFDYTLTLKMRDYFRLDSYDDRVYTLCQVNFGFKYVHELQHALRLCGIEKEIEI